MALTHFYMQSGASDLNAGSTTANAASLTYAGGTFVRATGIFTVASGNPLSDGVVVGDWVSIYTTAGATGCTFVGQCTARDATTITVSLTEKLGLVTTVSETAAASTAKVAGAWASEIALTSLGTFTAPQALKINIKAATYTIVASRTIAISGYATSGTKPVWFSGYNTTPGDLDNDADNALTKPVWSFNSTFNLTLSGTNQTWSGMKFLGTVSGTLVSLTGGSNKFSRCRVENLSTNAAGRAFQCTTAAVACAVDCHFTSPTNGTTSGTVYGNGSFVRCTSVGNGRAAFEGPSSGTGTYVACLIPSSAGDGFLLGNPGSARIHRCTIYNTTGDGIEYQNPSAAANEVIGCLLSNIGGVGIKNSSGTTPVDTVFRSANVFYSCSGGNETGLGDTPSFMEQTESSGPFVSAPTDLTPLSTSKAALSVYPGIWENRTDRSYVTAGATEPQNTGTAGGSVKVQIIGR